MKTCPVCKATCFDDMEICFECLHDFAADVVDIPDEADQDLVIPCVEERTFAEESIDIGIDEVVNASEAIEIGDDLISCDEERASCASSIVIEIKGLPSSAVVCVR